MHVILRDTHKGMNSDQAQLVTESHTQLTVRAESTPDDPSFSLGLTLKCDFRL